MQQRVLINGAQGKMGQLATKAIQACGDFQLVGELSRHDSLKAAILAKHPHIVLDLTSADCVYENSLTIIQEGVSPVIGTSGLLTEQIDTLNELCSKQQLGGMIIPNFSIAATLMMHFSTLASRFLPEVEIIESHHQQKLDAPSGTALKTAEMIAAARQHPKHQLPLKELLPGARGGNYHDVPIHSIRLPGILARQQVIFGQLGETLTITHDSIDRQSFMPGVILACQKVRTLKKLYYGLEHLLNLA